MKQTDEVIGFVNYHHRDMRNRRLEVGYILARSFWRRGLATEAVSSLLNHCFEGLMAYRIEATVSPANLASINFLKRLGFCPEGGPMRARMWTSDNRTLDALMFGLLAPEWKGKL
jgi:ribosomal-protein-alanine N-acetyltransferase